MPMTPKEAEGWARTRAKGRAHFIWVRVVIQYSLLMVAVWFLATYPAHGSVNMAARLFGTLVACAIIGYVWGTRFWANQERRYAETPDRGADPT